MMEDNLGRTRRFNGRQFRCTPLPPVSLVVLPLIKKEVENGLMEIF